MKRALIALLFALPASAATWRVEKDGAGDFTIIQDALDAAAAGDSILIGPGRFDDYRLVQYDAGGVVAAIVFTELGPLHIMGSGIDNTIIGPVLPTNDFDGASTVSFSLEQGVERNTVTDLTLENSRWASWVTSPVTFANVRFQGAISAQVGLEDAVGAEINSCEFLGFAPDAGAWSIVTFVGGVNDSLTIRDSLFKWGKGINLYGCDGFDVSDVRFEDVETPYLLDHVNGTITRSVAISPDIRGMELHDCTLALDHCWFGEGGTPTVYSANYNDVTADYCHFGGSSTFTLEIQGNYRFTNCNIEKGAGLTIKGPYLVSPVLPVLDFQNNYWGSNDSTEIASWILDGLDGGIPERAIIDFTPFRSDPVAVPTRPHSLSSLKSLFGPR